jgi:predicted nuclease of predicted toxin-antitoxin system
MRFLLDQGLSRSTTQHLCAAGHDAVHVGDIGLSAAEDGAILERGRTDDRVVVTLDADFHTLLALDAAARPSVIRIRIEGLRGAAVARILLAVVEACASDLDKGVAVTVQGDRIRLRRLPIVR